MWRIPIKRLSRSEHQTCNYVQQNICPSKLDYPSPSTSRIKVWNAGTNFQWKLIAFATGAVELYHFCDIRSAFRSWVLASVCKVCRKRPRTSLYNLSLLAVLHLASRNLGRRQVIQQESTKTHNTIRRIYKQTAVFCSLEVQLGPNQNQKRPNFPF